MHTTSTFLAQASSIYVQNLWTHSMTHSHVACSMSLSVTVETRRDFHHGHAHNG